MIAKLRGIVDSVGEDTVVLDVGGVGYLVHCSTRTLGALRPGEAAVLLVETHVREDAILLHGFADESEREWFRLLTTVQGVGTKAALGVLGALGVDQLLAAILSEDAAMVRRAPGVGPKLAARIVNELKGRAGGMMAGTSTGSGGRVGQVAGAGSSAASDAISALLHLGYGPGEAMRAVTAAGKSLGEAATVEQLIRGGLAELGPKDVHA